MQRRAVLFDHLVGEREQRRWHFEAERGHPPLLLQQSPDLEHGFHTPALLGES
jgi:hypothetical protein